MTIVVDWAVKPQTKQTKSATTAAAFQPFGSVVRELNSYWFSPVSYTNNSQMIDISAAVITVKLVLSGHSKIDKTKVVKLNEGRKYCRMLSWSILQYF